MRESGLRLALRSVAVIAFHGRVRDIIATGFEVVMLDWDVEDVVRNDNWEVRRDPASVQEGFWEDLWRTAGIHLHPLHWSLDCLMMGITTFFKQAVLKGGNKVFKSD